MGPTKEYQDTNDGIAAGIRKGYERPPAITSKSKISPQSSLSSNESDISPPSSLSSTESNPPPVDCANSTDESSTSSANSDGSYPLSCGNSTMQSSSSANSDGSYISTGSSLDLNPSTCIRNNNVDIDPRGKVLQIGSKLRECMATIFESPTSSVNSGTFNRSPESSMSSNESSISPASSMSSNESSEHISPASSMSSDESSVHITGVGLIPGERYSRNGTPVMNDSPSTSMSSNHSDMVHHQNEYGTNTLGDSNWTLQPPGNQRENLRSNQNDSGSSLQRSNPSHMLRHQATTPWERNGDRTRAYFDPLVRNRPSHPMTVFTIPPDIPQFQETYQTDLPIENNRGNKPRSPCCCSKRKAIGTVVFAALLLGIVVGIFVSLTQNVIDNAACQFLTNEIICPFEREYNRIDILSPPVYLKNGAGRTSYNLRIGTDIRINGFFIKVTDKDISVRKHPSECAEEGEYPIIFSRENNSQSETKLPLKIKDFNDTMQMEIIPFTNTSDNERYVQFICTGYHQCGTVVMDLELQAPDFGTYNTPMECSRTNIEGTVMDNYGYACTLIMGVDMFQRTDNLKCKPTVETLQNTKTTSIAQKSVDVNETTRSHFILRKLANETIKWNVNVQSLKDIRHLQTKYNGDFRGNKFDLDARVKLSTSLKGSIATCHVVFSPVTCIDEGPWELHLLNSTQHKEIKVTGTSTITACPSLVNGNVSEKLELKFTSCVPDDVRTYALNLYGKTNRRGSFLKDKSIEVVDQTSYFRAHLHLNELSVIYTKEPITCADHMMIFMMSLQTKGGDTIQNITSLTNVIVGRDRYKTYSTGGDFRENIPSVVSLRVHLGCRPQNMTIYINGSLLASKYALTEDRSTGEKIFTKSFSFPKLRMQDNGTVVELHCSFIDDEGSLRNLSITQVIRVIPDTFCLGRPHGCNYRHPYNSNMWIACGEGLIAEFGNCQSGLVFVPTSCEGKCL